MVATSRPKTTGVRQFLDLDQQRDWIEGVGSGWGRNDTLSLCLDGPKMFAGQRICAQPKGDM